MSDQLQNIPCNIISGFLGVGKTTAIKQLFEQKPAGERWAVLVNEFGEIGIDGGLVQPTSDEIFIKEVPGGCMCCAAGMPMRIALNMLLARAKPHRLLIEPTGLGHPQEVLETLSGEFYHDVIDMRSTITLVDARNIADTRYTENATFLQQLQVADHVVANKSDLYGVEDLAALEQFLADKDLSDTPLHTAVNGQLDLAWLTTNTKTTSSAHHHHSDEPPKLPMPGDDDFPESGYLNTRNQGEGFCSLGWLFKPEFVFNKEALDSLLFGLDVERLKAIMHTDSGFIGYNLASGVLTQIELENQPDSRLEIITDDEPVLADFGEALVACIEACSSTS